VNRFSAFAKEGKEFDAFAQPAHHYLFAG